MKLEIKVAPFILFHPNNSKLKFITVQKKLILVWLNVFQALVWPLYTNKQKNEALQKLVGTCPAKGGIVSHSGIINPKLIKINSIKLEAQISEMKLRTNFFCNL